MHIFKQLALSLTVGLIAISTPAMAEDKVITILTQQDVFNDYQKFIGQRDPLSLTQYGGPASRRDVVELVLVQQALKAGGNELPIKIVKVDNTSDSYNRYIKEITSGSATMGGNSAWLIDLKPLADKVLISEPVIRNGEFEAGLYTTSDNAEARLSRTLPEIQKLTAVVAESWKPDVATLESLKFSILLKTHSWDSMVGMLFKKRADVLLAPFQPTPDMSMDVGGKKLVPIQNVKVGLQGSRHFFVSKVDPMGAQVSKQLNAGLEKLREKGLIDKAYRDAGFFNSATKSWNRLN
ncbi:hypothetical protein HQ393_08505 [Chitinibacter bivalviorum]|uniref:Transporter substrate-binding domain-containing protein n=1 Tax=Chitinibacter bivalviorum TaxID=2739434 RepID=A0A7H9BLI6_9NEIS|nr:hypothetical protein [Chitinibacter bivalviorum]QLG88284.1 hypothetical protein HQ393_08505 [Chitinibacter bivalviorum]